MVNEIIKIMEKVPSHIDIGMSRDIRAFLEGNDEISSYKVTADEEDKILIDIRLKKYSFFLAKITFSNFVNFVGYGYFNLYIREELETQIKYHYVTTNHELCGTKMVIVIS